MQASYKRAVASLFHRGLGFLEQNQGQRMFSQMASVSRTHFQFGSLAKQIDRGSRTVLSQQSMWSVPRMQLSNSSCRNMCDKTSEVVTPVKGKTEQVQQVASKAQDQHFSARHPSNFDKRLLVYFGKYKSADEVPALVSVHLLNSTRNKFRVYVNMFLAFLTMAGCGFMIYRGHKRAGQGETIAEHNMRRHPEHYRMQQPKE